MGANEGVAVGANDGVTVGVAVGMKVGEGVSPETYVFLPPRRRPIRTSNRHDD